MTFQDRKIHIVFLIAVAALMLYALSTRHSDCDSAATVDGRISCERLMNYDAQAARDRWEYEKKLPK
jgi:hypothetical protein